MRDEHERRAMRLPQSKKMILQRATRQRIKRRERLVHQQYFGFRHQCAHDGYALSLTAAQFARPAWPITCKPNFQERFLDKVIALKPLKVCPAHGPMGGPEVLENQQRYFKSILTEVKKLKDAGKTAAEVQAAADTIKETLRKDDRIAIYIGQFFPMQVEKAWTEMGGAVFPAKKQAQAEPVRLKAKKLLAKTP